MIFDWETVRREDGTLDLVGALDSVMGGLETEEINLVRARQTLLDIESFSPVRSRQVAGLALIMVAALGGTAERIDAVQDSILDAAEELEDVGINLMRAAQREI